MHMRTCLDSVVSHYVDLAEISMPPEVLTKFNVAQELARLMKLQLHLKPGSHRCHSFAGAAFNVLPASSSLTS